MECVELNASCKMNFMFVKWEAGLWMEWKYEILFISFLNRTLSAFQEIRKREVNWSYKNSKRPRIPTCTRTWVFESSASSSKCMLLWFHSMHHPSWDLECDDWATMFTRGRESPTRFHHEERSGKRFSFCDRRSEIALVARAVHAVAPAHRIKGRRQSERAFSAELIGSI